MAGYALEGPRWGTGRVTWSLAAAGGAFSSALGPAWEPEARAAIAAWQAACGASFEQVEDGPDADVRIGFGRLGATGAEIGDASYGYYPSAAGGTFVPGTAVRAEDPFERPAGTPGPSAAYLGTGTTVAQVLLHEVGHALGLDHSADAADVMAPVAGPGNRTLSASDAAGARALYGPPAPAAAAAAQDWQAVDTATGEASTGVAEAYSGPVARLSHQWIWRGTDPVTMYCEAPGTFVKGGPGGDAITVFSGDNVIDGGQGSNFLTGGTGNDEFYLDGRGGQVTWGTLVGFHPGDMATLWGFRAGTSTSSWAASDGAEGYRGATLHADLAGGGGGGGTASVTFAGMGMAEASRLRVATGSVQGNDYMQLRMG